MLNHEIVPPRAPARGPRGGHHALVLHGLGDSLHGWKGAAPVLALDELGWVFVDAPIEYYGGFSWFGIDLGGSAPRVDLDEFADSRAKLEELIGHLLGRLGIGPDRLFLVGFSQGCAMALDVALRSAEPFAGVVGISGFIPTLADYPAAFGAAAKRQRALLTHGRWDDVIPIDWARMQAERLRALGVEAEWREYDKPHSLDPEREIADIRSWLRARMRAGAAAG